MNVLERIPAKVRLGLYLAYAVAGPVLVYTEAKGWTGQPEFNLWVGLGTALGLTAAANVSRTRRRLTVAEVPHEVVAADVVIVADRALDPEDRTTP